MRYHNSHTRISKVKKTEQSKTVEFSVPLFNKSTESPCHGNKVRKDMQIRKSKIKMSLFIVNTIIYEKMDTTKYFKIFLELISEFSKVSGYKVNTQKYILFLGLSNEHMKNKIRNNTIYN